MKILKGEEKEDPSSSEDGSTHEGSEEVVSEEAVSAQPELDDEHDDAAGGRDLEEAGAVPGEGDAGREG